LKAISTDIAMRKYHIRQTPFLRCIAHSFEVNCPAITQLTQHNVAVTTVTHNPISE